MLCRSGWLGVVLAWGLALGGCSSADADGEGGGPTVLKVPQEKVPQQVRAIERIIDTPALLKAENVIIHVSRNYEWDVALTGDRVARQRRMGDETVTQARGAARAMFRKLDIRAYGSITFRRSGLDVVPFIRITAKGHAIYVRKPEDGGEPVIRRARAIVVENEDIRFVDEPEGQRPPRFDPDAARPDPGGLSGR